jgi:RNA-directed DNA polymerase
MTRALEREIISTKQQKIAELARGAPQRVLLTLAHHIDLERMEEAYRRTRKDGAVGVDGVTAAAYEERLHENLSDLLERFKSGLYRAPPVRRVHIPKAGSKGKTRPIGIPTLEDKVLQRAVLMVLEPVYEQDFLDCSYGFRPGRSAHQALEALWKGLMDIGGGWVIDLDIQSYFDSIERTHLNAFLDQRVRDGVIRRALGKWMQAGVMEVGVISYPERGSPQGGVISPLVSNIYLHDVFDQWFEHTVKPRLRGRAFLVRFADDALLAFEREDDARRVLEVLPKRFARFGLTLHPEKTRLVDFRSPARTGGPSGSQRERSFDLLGFAHYWGRSRLGGATQDGQGPLQPRTAADRGLVPTQPPPPGGGATAGAGPQAQRPCRLLRDHRQRPCAVAIPLRGAAALAKVAQPSLPCDTARLVGLQPSAEALPAPPCARGPPCLRHVANV